MKMSREKFIEEFKKYNETEKCLILFDLMKNKQINVIILLQIYTKYLESEKNIAETKESIYASCLINAYHPISSDRFSEARTKILLRKWYDDEILNKLFKGLKKEQIEKEEKYIDEQLKNTGSFYNDNF